MATKDLDFGNVIKQVYDPPTESLKVLATISIGSISVDLDASTDSIRLGDGVLFLTSTTVGPKVGLDVNLVNTALPLSSNAATETKQDTQITILNSIDTKLTSPLAITASSLPLPIGAATENKQDTQINELITANNNLDAIETLLQAIDTKFTTPLPISGTVSVTEPLIVSGTEDGTILGTERAFVNNQRLQVLASHDREEDYTYVDFGTKNQRIIRVEYSSATFPGIIVRRDFNYVLDSGRYKLLDSVWSIV